MGQKEKEKAKEGRRQAGRHLTHGRGVTFDEKK